MRIMNTCNKKCDCIGGLKFVSVAPALTGAMKPEKGLYCNAIVRYEETGEIWIYTKEGIPVDITSSDPAELERKIREVAQNLSSETAARIAADLAIEESLAGKQNEITTSNKLDADLVDDSTSDNKFATAEELSAIETAVQPEDIDYTLVSGLALDSNPSTTTMQLDASKVNISSGATSSENIPFAVASSTQAGIMNSATFNAVTDNTNNINALLNGAVAVSGLPTTPTQAQLTTAWQIETGLTTLINRAQIYDVANSKVWTYYTNDTTWHEATAGGQITINTFTNLSEGTIKGSTNVGQVFAENDGTGSVNGWDALDARVTNNTNNMIRVGSVISQPTTVAYVDTANIIDGAVTNAKIAPSISQVEISFHILNPAVRTGTGQATLIRIPGNIGILTYNGTTGFNDSGTGDRQINVYLDNAGFDSILGGSQTSWYALNPGAYQTYSRVFLTPGGDARIDNYVYKDTATQQERMISFVIIGTLGS